MEEKNITGTPPDCCLGGETSHADRRCVAIVGAGAVGMSCAYAMLCRSACDKIIIIDVNRLRAEGEAADLSHGISFADTHMRIIAGDYAAAAEADILIICAGAAQREGEDRLSLLGRNAVVVKSIVGQAIEAGFNGIFLTVTNPVDIMTGVTLSASGFPPERVMGSGTTLDTARLRQLLGDYFSVDPRNIHAYVMGEHGDSEFIPWSQAMIATKPVLDLCDDCPDRYRYEDLMAIGENVKTAAASIIAAKGNTSYGIGMAVTRIVRAVFGDENSILTVSSMLRGEYGQNGVCAGSPCVVGRSGIKSRLRLSLADYELSLMDDSCRRIRQAEAML